MNYVLYPPQTPPAQLTAKAAAEHLGEHFQAFLKANNLFGWRSDLDYELRDDRVADIMVRIGNTMGMSIGQIQYHGKVLKKLYTASKIKIPHIMYYNIVANCLGYDTYQFAYMCRSADNYVNNLWPTDMVLAGQLLSSKTLGHSKVASLPEEIRARIRFNAEHAKSIGSIKKIDKKNRSDGQKQILKKRRKSLKQGGTSPLSSRGD